MIGLLHLQKVIDQSRKVPGTTVKMGLPPKAEGLWLVTFTCDGFSVLVSWAHDKNFYVTTPITAQDDQGHEYYENPDDVIRRVQHLLVNKEGTQRKE